MLRTRLSERRLSNEGAASRRRRSSLRRSTITSMFCHFPGEVYTDIPTIQRVCGLVPRDTRAEREQMALTISDHARDLGLDTIAAHIGFGASLSATSAVYLVTASILALGAAFAIRKELTTESQRTQVP